ncbi:STAS domain-containing protein [Streptomyces sp. NPDC058622]|uniref:STAS domain-containing protein n=1 Tax=Streptomyces sp. NPDC058622 TaxID=3346562 RepID=UPI003667B0B0
MEITRLVLPGPSPTPQDAARLCARLVLLYEAGAAVVVCDVRAVTAPDLGAVEALARLRLAAHGRGGLTVTGAGPALRGLLGEAEQREPPGGVQEGVEPDDLPV